ncbi:hypothetical protein E6P09_02450 [Haloferax mediterranei ATCC 33500]|uniref:Uncharacterized protein n=1 Tax=Haloferax mediterranei (strain ATCC 33500 / DSM 1411 / JCM 8866 / NBRC 14739 / NCIMB 2177 / R-4) TaxID=523841 RepID=I3R5N6_HALMT|nr:hypothetical protein [Haloferax mediterranei]AFK19546.1 hypothetical protein HFX_1848 [Haloferax mediterranei ATCC 33500]AHZ22940.1 hypothetical protein BM92_09965 [Haloferax mediterranei ATCC 33500]ELZ99866.1 hypothetical protein C439_11043 [Haloferax mediterranei ATCC 33500]MDX5987711.1 hypothetical protein [Haloferax mediterranei ATCC 33500]QCQ74195.1 hypothetical protein E6P09_02450 [Haloferax mediterranei ATCC 33500]
MVGTTLIQIRNHIETLAADEGDFTIVCGRTGERPVPTAGLTFGDRATAENAVRAATQYRSALRRYDPQLPYYDLIVTQDGKERPTPARSWGSALDEGHIGAAAVGNPKEEGDRPERIEFCHSVAAAVFEALSNTGHRTVETAVMDAYFDLAETISSPDELCLRLLESMATELHAHLESAEQADVLARAASRLPTPPESADSLEATLGEMERLGLVGSYSCSSWTTNPDDGTKSADITLKEYALSARNGRLPALPVVLDLYRRRGPWKPISLHVTRADGEWRGRVAVSTESEGVGLASVPIHPGVPE